MLPATSSPPHLIVSLFHPPLSLFFFFQSSFSPVFFTSLLTLSSHLSLGLPRLLQPCSRNSAALFGSLSSAILSTCPAHCSLLLTSLSVKLLCTPVSSLNSALYRVYTAIYLSSNEEENNKMPYLCGLRQERYVLGVIAVRKLCKMQTFVN